MTQPNTIPNISHVKSVYSGRPGCCCGCRGKHIDVGSKRSVARILANMERALECPDAQLEVNSEYVSVETETRLYVAYL